MCMHSIAIVSGSNNNRTTKTIDCWLCGLSCCCYMTKAPWLATLQPAFPLIWC